MIFSENIYFLTTSKSKYTAENINIQSTYKIPCIILITLTLLSSYAKRTAILIKCFFCVI